MKNYIKLLIFLNFINVNLNSRVIFYNQAKNYIMSIKSIGRTPLFIHYKKQTIVSFEFFYGITTIKAVPVVYDSDSDIDEDTFGEILFNDKIERDKIYAIIRNSDKKIVLNIQSISPLSIESKEEKKEKSKK